MLHYSIDPPSQTVSPGDTFSTTIVISDVVDLGGFEFDLSYDPDVIHVLDVTMGDFPVSTGRTWTALGPDIDNEAGLTSFGSI